MTWCCNVSHCELLNALYFIIDPSSTVFSKTSNVADYERKLLKINSRRELKSLKYLTALRTCYYRPCQITFNSMWNNNTQRVSSTQACSAVGIYWCRQMYRFWVSQSFCPHLTSSQNNKHTRVYVLTTQLSHSHSLHPLKSV